MREKSFNLYPTFICPLKHSSNPPPPNAIAWQKDYWTGCCKRPPPSRCLNSWTPAAAPSSWPLPNTDTQSHATSPQAPRHPVHPGALVLMYLHSCHQLPSPTHLPLWGGIAGRGWTQHALSYFKLLQQSRKVYMGIRKNNLQGHICGRVQEQDLIFYPFSTASALKANLQRKVFFLPCR